MSRSRIKPHGIVPAIVTPLDKNEQINEPALRRLVNFLIDGGVHGLLPLGTTGEAWTFSNEERKRILEIVVDETRSRVPIYAGTGTMTTRGVIELNAMAQAIGGIDAVTVITPFFISPTQQELYEHYAAIAKATRLPVLLYNNPGRTSVNLAIETVQRLAQIENIIGMKDSSGNLTQTASYITACPPDFVVFIGADTLILAGLVYGCVGAVAVTGNAVPRLLVDIYDRFQEGDLPGARAAQERLSPLRAAMGLGPFPVVIKEALDLMGFDAGPCRRPLGPISSEAREKLRAILHEVGAL